MTAAATSLLPCCSRLLFLVIFLTAATSPSSGWLQIIPPINYYSSIIHPPSRPSSFHSSSRLLPRRSSQLHSSRDDNEERNTANIQTTGSGGGGSDQLQLRIGKRVGSGAYGTVHIATHLIDDSDETRYIAKRAWTLSELELNVPMAVMQLDNNYNSQRTGVVCATGLAEQGNNNNDIDSSDNDDDTNSNNEDKLKETAARCQYYWNVERHIVQKLASASSIEEGGDTTDSLHVTPQFKGVYQSAPINDNNDDGGEQGEIVPGYGTINKLDTAVDDNNNNQGMGAFFSMFNDGDDDNKEGLCHEWMVFEYIPSPLLSDEESSLPALTLLDAMGVSSYISSTNTINNLFLAHSPR